MKEKENSLPKVYNPSEAEEKWYKFWTSEGLFKYEAVPHGKPFSIVIPPPNVTGYLHIGHALNSTLQDILIRYKRMDGYKTWWIVGMDHAGIATQNVVERQLRKEGKSRYDLGREKFIERVWKWKEESGGMIRRQLMRLGASCDWSRERFTMDSGLSRAVRKVFVSLYKKGLIYRDDYIINWCPRCKTALSDLEVEPKEEEGKLYHIKYPLADKSGEYLIIATTRPETMLGDTAVAVNPADKRYKNIIGNYVILPLTERKIPVIADEAVDMSFGTGALKVTPAHDFDDFEIGKRHGLDRIKIFDENADLTEEAGKSFKGLNRTEARKKVLEELDKAGLLVKTEKHVHRVGHCYRCGETVEPMLSLQWFVKTKPLAKRAIEAVEKSKTVFVPKQWEKTYFEWMRNIRDWCISRQIWWGHRIPAWHCKSCGNIDVEENDPSTCSKCESKDIQQDTDVLDTWFSSALWPFSTLGWPEETKELKEFYPTSVLVTAFDIIFFWVARMMMMGLEFMNDVPFKKVYIHALVRDAERKKMSKSKGNVIDPLKMMDKYGTDAFRFTLAAFAAQGRDIIMAEDRIVGYRNFCNKIWNAARFVFMNKGNSTVPTTPIVEKGGFHAWIVGRLSNTAEEVRKALDDMKFNEAAASIYKFTWHEFCDWYLEFIKKDLYGPDETAKEAAQKNMLYVFEQTLRLLHPFMPFITEELWQKLDKPADYPKSIMLAPFPSPKIKRDKNLEKEVDTLIEIIRGIRNIRGENAIPPSAKITVQTGNGDKKTLDIIERYSNRIAELCGAKEIVHLPKPDKFSASAICAGVEIFVPLKGLIDPEKEKKRLEKELTKAEDDLNFAEKRLANEKFMKNAPPELVKEVKLKKEDAEVRLAKIKSALERINSVLKEI